MPIFLSVFIIRGIRVFIIRGHLQIVFGRVRHRFCAFSCIREYLFKIEIENK